MLSFKKLQHLLVILKLESFLIRKKYSSSNMKWRYLLLMTSWNAKIIDTTLRYRLDSHFHSQGGAIVNLALSSFIPEQFTVKAHPAVFERERERERERGGEEGVSQKMRHCYSSLHAVDIPKKYSISLDIHFQNAHKTLPIPVSLQLTYTLSKRAQNTKNCEG